MFLLRLPGLRTKIFNSNSLSNNKQTVLSYLRFITSFMVIKIIISHRLMMQRYLFKQKFIIFHFNYYFQLKHDDYLLNYGCYQLNYGCYQLNYGCYQLNYDYFQLNCGYFLLNHVYYSLVQFFWSTDDFRLST